MNYNARREAIMANCRNCGAPLPPDSLVCLYCRTRHDADLAGIHRYTVEKPAGERICPRCTKPLQTIDLHLGGKFLIERCPTCYGLFFDPSELEAVLDRSVANVYRIDLPRLEEVARLCRHQDYPVTYIKCPVCAKLMNRVNFGTKSGVIVDTCREHGVWLDGGELRQLLEWSKAGGQFVHQQAKIEQEHEEIQRERERAHSFAMGDRQNWNAEKYARKLLRQSPSTEGFLELLVRFIRWLCE
jgi:Zn-finger nucleic acid-binding protein